MTWSVTAPNPIVTSNAHSQSETTATWELAQSNGWTRLQINAEEGDCPTGGFELHLQADVSGGGTALLTVPAPITGDADTQAIVGALAAAGWDVSGPNPGDDTFVASWAWSDPADLATLGDVLPPLEGSDFTLVTTDDTAMDFDARLDLSFYEAFWQGINPALDDPPFLFTWAPPVGNTLSGGDWTDDKALQFAWDIDTDGRIFNMWTATNELGTAPASDDGTSDDPDDGVSDSEADGDSDQTDSDGTEAGAESVAGAGTGTTGQAVDGADQGSGSEAGSAGPASDDSDAGLAVSDEEDVTDPEAAAMALAGLLVAAGMGVLTLGDVMAGNSLDAAFGSSPEPTEPTEAQESDDHDTNEEQPVPYTVPDDPDIWSQPVVVIDPIPDDLADDYADEFGARSVGTAYEEGAASTEAETPDDTDAYASTEGDTTEDEIPDDTDAYASTERDTTEAETPDDTEGAAGEPRAAGIDKPARDRRHIRAGAGFGSVARGSTPGRRGCLTSPRRTYRDRQSLWTRDARYSEGSGTNDAGRVRRVPTAEGRVGSARRTPQ